MRASTRLVSVLSVCAALSVSRAAFAQSADEREATAVAQQGLVARREGRDADALAAFERSLSIVERASVRAQLGFAQQALGRWVDAERTLERASQLDDPWVRRYRATIDRSLADVRAHLGSLSISVEPAPSEVLVDGVALVSNTGAPIRVAIGTVTVTARREGYFPIERTVTIRAGETATETIVLRARPVETVEAPRVIERRVERVTPRREAPRRAVTSDARWWIAGTATAGSGALALGASAVLWALREGALRSLTGLGCAEGSVDYVCAATVDADRARALHGEASAESAASVVALTVGVAAVSVGAALLVFEAVRRGRERPAVTVTLSPGGALWRF